MHECLQIISIVTTKRSVSGEDKGDREALLASEMRNPDFGAAKTDECRRKGQFDRSITGHDFLKRALRTASTRLQQKLKPYVGSEDFLVPLRDVLDVSEDSRHWGTFWDRI